MTAAGVIWPLLAAYARHVGRGGDPHRLRADLERRLSMLPLWARLYMAASALFVRRVAPPLLLGRRRAFEGLGADEAELLLERLQRQTRPAARAAFLGVKSLILACCYADPAFLAGLGYVGQGAIAPGGSRSSLPGGSAGA